MSILYWSLRLFVIKAVLPSGEAPVVLGLYDNNPAEARHQKHSPRSGASFRTYVTP